MTVDNGMKVLESIKNKIGGNAPIKEKVPVLTAPDLNDKTKTSITIIHGDGKVTIHSTAFDRPMKTKVYGTDSKANDDTSKARLANLFFGGGKFTETVFDGIEYSSMTYHIRKNNVTDADMLKTGAFLIKGLLDSAIGEPVDKIGEEPILTVYQNDISKVIGVSDNEYTMEGKCIFGVNEPKYDGSTSRFYAILNKLRKKTGYIKHITITPKEEFDVIKYYLVENTEYLQDIGDVDQVAEFFKKGFKPVEDDIGEYNLTGFRDMLAISKHGREQKIFRTGKASKTSTEFVDISSDEMIQKLSDMPSGTRVNVVVSGDEDFPIDAGSYVKA